MSNQIWIFIGTVFVTVVLLSQAMIVPVFGEGRKTRKKLKARLGELERELGQGSFSSLLREKYLRELSPLERSLEQLPFMAPLTEMIEQAGHSFLAHRLLLAAIGLGVAGAAGAWTFTHNALFALLAAAVGATLPFLKVARDRTQRIQKIEEQLPEAVDMMKRALRAVIPSAARSSSSARSSRRRSARSSARRSRTSTTATTSAARCSACSSAYRACPSWRS